MTTSKDIQTALTNFANAQFQLGVATAQLEAILNPLFKEKNVDTNEAALADDYQFIDKNL
jgi:hypothetical protein